MNSMGSDDIIAILIMVITSLIVNILFESNRRK